MASSPVGIETSLREKDGAKYLFVLNHNAEASRVSLGLQAGTDLLTDKRLTGDVELAGRDLWIIKLDA